MTVTTASPKARPPLTQRQRSEKWFAWLLIAPAFIFILVIVAWPLVETVRLSFTNADLGGEEYIGTKNYTDLAKSRKFSQTISRTFSWMFFSVTLKLILGLIGATLLNAHVKGKGLFRMLVMPPWVIPIAIGCIGWLWLYNGHFGILSGVAQKTGLIDGSFEFLAYKNSAYWSSRWYRFRRITIPQIFPVIVSMMLLSSIWTFNSFEVIWILTEGGPRSATTTLIVDTYKTAIANFKFGKGAARAVIIVIVLTLWSIVYLYILNKLNKRFGNA
jgi:multiple sugar transport system permease protein